jgi:predicted dehydrogenase
MVTLGFLGTGWIGRNRMEAMLATGEAKAVAICDPNPGNAAAAQELAPDGEIVGSFDELLRCEPDGVVIATPSALHAEQCVRAFGKGAAVFCQKPLGRTAAEVQSVLDSARKADRLLGVDLSYRHTAAMQAIRERRMPHRPRCAPRRPHPVDVRFSCSGGGSRQLAPGRARAGH